MINSDKKPFTAVAVKDDGLGGTSLPKPQTPTYQQPKPKQQTTNQTAGQTTNRITKGTDQKKPDTYETTAVTADDFLRGFNEGYEEEPSTPTYSSQQTTNQPPKPLPGNSVRKNQNSRGVSAVTADDFIRGFNEGYEENEPTVPEPRNPSLVDLTVNSFDKGYNNAARGQEAWKSMYGHENDLDKYNELLSSDKYNFETDDWWEKMISGASGHLGQWVRQLTDPETVAMSLGAGGTALLAGQAGPQALLPEEFLTVPVAFTAAMKAGNAKTNMEIEGGNAYLEMLDNGVSEETARAIATGVGGVNAMLETLQLDELLKAYNILDKAEADDTLLNLLVREVTKRSLDTAVETGQEDLQELATIAGVQLGSKIDTGEWVYSFADMVRRVWDTTKESLLTFGLTNLPSTVHNVSTQNSNHVVTENVTTASPTFANSKDQLYQNSKKIEPIKGYEDVVVHGDMYGFVFKNADGIESVVSVHEFADILKESGLYNGGDIRLISCETGKPGALTAQGLANKLEVNVLAPTDVVYIFGDGRMIVSSDGYTNDGEWVLFEPTNRIDGGVK